MHEQQYQSERLYSWQEQALIAWVKADGRGIIEAMTGTGKTSVGIKAIKQLLRTKHNISPLIVVPTIALLNQWYTWLKEEFPNKAIGRIGNGYDDTFAKTAHEGALPIALVGTVHSAVKRVEKGLLDHCKLGTGKSLLIADECHHYCNEDTILFNRILQYPFDYTMGLSATIEPFEVQGLGKIVYTYNIKSAHKDGLVPSFNIVNIGIEFTGMELNQYIDLREQITNQLKIVKTLYSTELEGLEDDLFWRRLKQLFKQFDDQSIKRLLCLIFKRAALCYTATEKLNLAPQIIKHLVEQEKKKVMVFFERIWSADVTQADISIATAHSLHKGLTQGDGIWAKVFHSGLSRSSRDAVLAEFARVGASALLACRALDEGLDVPSVDVGILVGSSQSTRQKLQRIGRVLRRGDGSKKPLIIILYVRGTNDENVRIDANNHDFAGVAKIHDCSGKNCLTLIQSFTENKAASNTKPEQSYVAPVDITPQNYKDKVFVYRFCLNKWFMYIESLDGDIIAQFEAFGAFDTLTEKDVELILTITGNNNLIRSKQL